MHVLGKLSPVLQGALHAFIHAWMLKKVLRTYILTRCITLRVKPSKLLLKLFKKAYCRSPK